MERKLTRNELFEMLADYGKVEKGCATFRGESWTRSGKYYDYSGGSHSMEPEKPRKFVEFHKFLKDKFPRMSYMEYLEIEDNCLYTDTDYEQDYYTERSVEYWVADIDKLVEYLPEYHEYDYEMTCKYCGETFNFDENCIDHDIEGGLMGDWDGVRCPHCHKYNETYPGNRTKLHE